MYDKLPPFSPEPYIPPTASSGGLQSHSINAETPKHQNTKTPHTKILHAETLHTEPHAKTLTSFSPALNSISYPFTPFSSSFATTPSSFKLLQSQQPSAIISDQHDLPIVQPEHTPQLYSMIPSHLEPEEEEIYQDFNDETLCHDGIDFTALSLAAPHLSMLTEFLSNNPGNIEGALMDTNRMEPTTLISSTLSLGPIRLNQYYYATSMGTHLITSIPSSNSLIQPPQSTVTAREANPILPNPFPASAEVECHLSISGVQVSITPYAIPCLKLSFVDPKKCGRYTSSAPIMMRKCLASWSICSPSNIVSPVTFNP